MTLFIICAWYVVRRISCYPPPPSPTGAVDAAKPRRRRRQDIDYKNISPHLQDHLGHRTGDRARSGQPQSWIASASTVRLTEAELLATKGKTEKILAADASRQAKKAAKKEGAKGAAWVFQKKRIANPPGDVSMNNRTAA